MCEFSGRLVAWLDQELPPEQAGRLEQHLQSCSDCRRLLAAYEKVNRALAVYCDALTNDSRSTRGRFWLAGAGAAIAAGLVLIWFLPRSRTEHLATSPAPTVHSLALAVEPPAARIPATHRRQSGARRASVWIPAMPISEPEFQIAIPAEAIFPPGAIPEGYHFIADLSIAPDGSPQGLRLIP